MNFLKDLNKKEEVKNIKEITLIVINLLKEMTILLIALIIIFSYSINKDNGYDDCEKPSVSNNNSDGSWLDCLKHIINDSLTNVMGYIKECLSTFVCFIILIGLMYYFFNIIKSPNQFSLTKKSFDANVQFMLKDFWNKLTFLLLFPTLFISIVSLFYTCIKIFSDMPKISTIFGFITTSLTQISMFLLVLILFYVVGQPLYYLLSMGNISYLYNISALDSMMYIISFFLISILIFAGFYKLLIFNLRSTFMPNIMNIINKLYSKEIIPFSIVIQIILFIVVLMSIKELFSFEVWIFAIIIFIIFLILLGQIIYKSINTN